jgi:tetratricopeptide (TPR) repeat protein
MKKTRILFFVSVLLCFCLSANAQTYLDTGMQRMDSLKQAIKKSSSDTAKINILNQLTQQYINLNYLAAADSTAREALKKADQLNYKQYKADSYNKIGVINLTRNEIDSAKTYFIKALEEDKRSKNRCNYIKHLGNIGLCYTLQLNYDQALSCHKSALRMAELFKEKQVLPFCYNNIGAVYLSKSQFKEAHSYFSSSLAANTDNQDKNSKFMSLKFISEIYQSMGDYSLALKYLDQALNEAHAIGNKFKIQICLASLANIYTNLGNRATALDYYFQALKIAEETKNKKEIAYLLGDIGGRYYDMGDKKKGLTYFKKGYTKMLESGNKNGIAQATGNLGLIYFEQGDYDKAINYYEKSITLMKDVGLEEISQVWINNIAQVYQLKAKQTKTKDSVNYYNERCLSYLMQALDLANRFEKKNESVHSYYLIAAFYQDQRQLKKAEAYFKKCIEQSILTGEINYRQDAHNQLSELYGAQKKFQLQVEHYKTYILLKDSVINLAGAEKKVRSELNFEYEQKHVIEKEKQKQQNNLIVVEKKRQKTILWSVISGALLIMLAATFMYRSYLQKKKTNRELEHKNHKIRQANKIIKEKNHEITDSINYALHIQQAILPHKKDIHTLLPQSFILFQPKDIVSGDFYFFTTQHNKIFIAAADCTGHGVPGGFMSMISSEKLNNAVKQSADPGKILSLVNEGIKSSLHQSEHDYTNRDGMDIALCAIDLKNSTIEFAGANRPVWILRKNGAAFEEFVGTKASIGGITESDKSFETNRIQLQPGDTFYIFSDGYADQFGVNNKKMTTRRFRNHLLEIKNTPLTEQEQLLETFMKDWKGDTFQTDDILVIGVRI